MAVDSRNTVQKEAVERIVCSSCDHPTAETVYLRAKKELPNISLGTVYRNLSLLTQLGEIKKLTTSIGPDRFDGNIAPHYHVLCTKCGRIQDLEMESIDHIDTLAGTQFDGKIEGHFTYFYGRCRDCLEKENLK